MIESLDEQFGWWMPECGLPRSVFKSQRLDHVFFDLFAETDPRMLSSSAWASELTPLVCHPFLEKYVVIPL